MRLDAEEDDVGRADRGEVAGRLRSDLEVAVWTDDAQAAGLHRLQVRAAREQHDVGARAGEPRADVAADRPGAGDDDPHTWENAWATTRRWILPVAVRGMASVM